MKYSGSSHDKRAESKPKKHAGHDLFDQKIWFELPKFSYGEWNGNFSFLQQMMLLRLIVILP